MSRTDNDPETAPVAPSPSGQPSGPPAGPDSGVQTQQARLQSAILLLLGLGLFCALPFVLSIGSVV